METATSRIKRQILKRDFSVAKTEEIFKICREIGLRSFAFDLLANPTETPKEMCDTLRLNAELLPDGLKVSLGPCSVRVLFVKALSTAESPRSGRPAGRSRESAARRASHKRDREQHRDEFRPAVRRPRGPQGSDTTISAGHV